jgi:regulator of replication initiation timing
MPKAAHTVDLEPIDRLEEKVKRLVAMVDRLRNEHARAVEDNQRLRSEIDAARQRLSEADGRSHEMTTLIEERNLIRGRVADMLEQLEALNL